MSTPGLSAAKTRIVDAALALFAAHGVSGTSLQMIADALGVTKAAVYHQFHTKEDIVLAAADEPLRRLEAALDAAEAEDRPERGIEVLLAQLVDLTVEKRVVFRALQADPTLVRLLSEHERFRRIRHREHRILTSGDDGAEARVRAAMVSAALAGAAAHPLVTGIDDETLRAHLLDLARRLAGI